MGKTFRRNSDDRYNDGFSSQNKKRLKKTKRFKKTFVEQSKREQRKNERFDTLMKED